MPDIAPTVRMLFISKVKAADRSHSDASLVRAAIAEVEAEAARLGVPHAELRAAAEELLASHGSLTTAAKANLQRFFHTGRTSVDAPSDVLNQVLDARTDRS